MIFRHLSIRLHLLLPVLLCKLLFMESLSANKWFYLLWKHKPAENTLRCCINKLNYYLWNDYSFFS